MDDQQVWLITGAARGMGVELARAALAAGAVVMGTAGDADRVASAIGAHERLFAIPLDVTDPDTITAAVQAAEDRFGRIDVLVNNAGTFQAGPFEEVTDAQFRTQMDVNFFGPLAVTRAVLPGMRRRRAGHVITFSSTAGVAANPGGSAYAASKFALEGWMEALHGEVAPFGIRATIVEPGFFRTELLVEGSSTLWPERSIDDYAESTGQIKSFFRSMAGKQSGDPAKLAARLVQVVALEQPPIRWVAGDDAVEQVTQKGRDLIAQAGALPELSSSLDVD